MKNLVIAAMTIFVFCVVSNGFASNRRFPPKFEPGFACKDTPKRCTDKGKKILDANGNPANRGPTGIEITRDCWNYAYKKTCNVPSKDNCIKLSHCYWIRDVLCLLRDRFSNCVNVKKEFNCKTWIPVTKKSEYGLSKFKDKQGDPTMVCSGIPCIDGNCIDKSYMTNGEMMDSLSKLATVSQMKNKNNSVSLFEGKARHCTKKVVGYSNCCKVGVGKGWGKTIGAHCSKDEKLLYDLRSKNLCVYVGKQSKGRFKKTVKHRYCCFANLLEKIVQEQGRRQIGRSFGNGYSADCSGLTINDIQRIDFSRIDFSEFIEDVKKQFAVGDRNLPNTDDVKARFKDSVGQMSKDFEDGNNDNGLK